jgi:hypothetical protein
VFERSKTPIYAPPAAPSSLLHVTKDYEEKKVSVQKIILESLCIN